MHELTRYIHLNPVRTGMVEHPARTGLRQESDRQEQDWLLLARVQRVITESVFDLTHQLP